MFQSTPLPERNRLGEVTPLPMMKIARFAFAFGIALAFPPAFPQEMYTCTVDGKKVFQDKPCKGATIVPQNPARKSTAESPSPATPAKPQTASTDEAATRDKERRDAYLADAERGRKIRDAEYQIKILDSEIERLGKERDDKMAVLKRKKSFANNNLAGAVWEDSLSNEMQAVATQYDTTIASKREEMKHLREELVRLKK